MIWIDKKNNIPWSLFTKQSKLGTERLRKLNLYTLIWEEMFYCVLKITDIEFGNKVSQNKGNYAKNIYFTIFFFTAILTYWKMNILVLIDWLAVTIIASASIE